MVGESGVGGDDGPDEPRENDEWGEPVAVFVVPSTAKTPIIQKTSDGSLSISIHVKK